MNRAHGLPASVSSFLGRETELAELAGLLEHSRLVTLTGAPGIGKSRLGLELATQLAGGYPDGAWLVELAPLREGGLVAGALAAALAVPEAAGQSLPETIVARLRDRRSLVVLDNCEHLIEACAGLVDALLRACPDLAVLATSREALQISGERVWQVPPLPVPGAEESAEPDVLLGYEAVYLFVERARAVQPAFGLNAYVAPAVAEISRRLDGIPLAIEFAAARIEILTPAEIARRLDDRFALLRKGSRSELSRYQTLEAALDWSHELLSAPERALLRRLSVFTGGFCLAACEEICSGEDLEPRELLGLLDRLVGRSLVLAETNNGSPRARYRLLETISAYAQGRLEGAGEAAGLREAHARFYLSLAEEAEPQLTGPAQESWLERLEAERANLRAALEWSLSHGQSKWALRLAGALVLFWRVRCHFSEGRDLLDAAVAASNGGAVRPRAKALWGAGFLTFMAGDLEGALPALEESLARFRELDDLEGEARALLVLGNAAQYASPERALALLEESATIARKADDSWCLAHALGVAGFEYNRRDQPAVARSLLEECLVVAREAKDKQGLRFGLLGLGSVTVHQGEYRLAEPILEEALAVTNELGEDYGKATALQYLGQLAVGRGDYGRARDLLEQALTLLREAGSPPKARLVALVYLADAVRADDDRGRARRLYEEALGPDRTGVGPAVGALQGLGELAAEEGDAASARRMLDQALDLARGGGDKESTAQALRGLGELGRAEGDSKRAAALHNEALQLEHQIGHLPGVAASLEAVAGLAVAAGRCAHAARLFGAAKALREEKGYARLPWERSSYERDQAVLRESLSAEDLRAAFVQGGAMPAEEAVAQASKGRGRRGRSATGWSSLTEAERQVSALVAEGLTNPEIAERLFVSLGTVKAHLSHIFAKLTLAGRRELAREVRGRERHPPTSER